MQQATEFSANDICFQKNFSYATLILIFNIINIFEYYLQINHNFRTEKLLHFYALEKRPELTHHAKTLRDDRS